MSAAASISETALYDAILSSVQPGQTTVEMGDMIVPVETVRAWRDKVAGVRSASQAGVNKWTGGVVYYSFNANVSPAHRAHFLDACAEWATFANLTFTAHTAQANYIKVNDVPGLGGGNSAVGMIGGEQQLNIGSTSWNRGTLVHELGHALGLIHEHQRADRNTYVTIVTANVPGGAGDPNFIRIPASTNNGAYDFLSVMHYRRDALTTSPGQDTIVCKAGYTQYQNLIGTAPLDRILSRGDREGIAAMYGAGPALSLVVTNTKDAGAGSLRAAIYHALDMATDAPAATPVITFQIPVSDPGFSSGVFTIRPTDRLPGPGPRVTIDAATQSSFTGNTNASGPEVVLHGGSISSTDSFGRGLWLGDNGATVRGLVIQTFSTYGVLVTGTNNKVEGCYIGTNAAGTAAAANAYGGVEIKDGATGNIIGGTTAMERNVISGNSGQGVVLRGAGTAGNTVLGNHIGTNATGTSPLANAYSGVEISGGAGGNTIGGAGAGARNVISGNTHQGVSINGGGTAGNTVTGNYCGLNAAGTSAVGNGFGGLQIFEGASDNIIGPGNAISGNPTVGISVSGTSTSDNTITGNYCGTNPAGTAAIPNGYSGVSLYGGTVDNKVGPGNVLSGNANQGVLLIDAGTTDNTVHGNLIGVNASGTAAIPNGWAGVQIAEGASGNLIGGTTAAHRNVISGNNNQGVILNGANTTGNQVKGNYIGLNAAGTVALGNVWPGVELFSGAWSNTIGGLEASAGNVISANGFRGVSITGAGTRSNVFTGNLVGLNAAGSAAIPNAGPGFAIFDGAPDNVIGATAGGRNFIAGNNGPGISISQTGTNGTVITGNSIGVSPTGTMMANANDGVEIFGGALGTQVGGTLPGSANLIRGNTGHGVAVYESTTRTTRISGNAITGNGGLGIELNGGANNAQAAPMLTTAALGNGTTVTGSLSSTASTVFRIEFFTNSAADGEGASFIGTLNGTTGTGGSYTINTTLPAAVPAGWFITATATNPAGNTSEFSTGRVVTTTDTDSDGMPNAWETANGLLTTSNDAALDADQDGMSNYDEFRAGTNPRNPLSLLHPGSPSFTATGLSFPISGVSGKTYRVEYTENLIAWRLLADQLLSTGPPLTITDPSTAGVNRRLYRVLVSPP